MERTAYVVIQDVCYRVQYNPDYDEIEISNHAVDKYLRYHPGMTNRARVRARKALRRLLAQSFPVEIKQEHRVSQMLRHGIDHDVGYRRSGVFLLVLVDNELRTLHQNESKRWNGFPK